MMSDICIALSVKANRCRLFLIAIMLWLAISGSGWAITGLGIGAHAGIVRSFDFNFSKDLISYKTSFNMPMIGAHLNINTLPIIDFTGFVDYAWKEKEALTDVRVKLSDLSFGVAVKKKLSTPIIKPYLGGGIAWHRLIFSANAGVATIIIPDDKTQIGYLIAGGAEADIPMFPLKPFGEYRYNWVKVSGVTAKFDMLMIGVSLSL